MKYLLGLLTVVVLGVGSSFATFVPSASLDHKIDTATEALMDMVVEKGASYGDLMLSILEDLHRQFSARGNERNSYIADRLINELTPFLTCVTNDGTWVLGVDECEYVDRLVCLEMNGTYDACASACRHEEDSIVCTRECVPVCEVSIDRGSPTYDGMDDTDFDQIVQVASTRRSCTNEQGYVDTCYQVKPHDQMGRDLTTEEIVGFNWEKGFTYTLRVTEIDGQYTLIEIVDKEVDLTVCEEYFDGCNTCEVENGNIVECTNRYCSDRVNLPERCTEFAY